MKKVFIITGEYSADIHAAKVVEYLKRKYNDIEIQAIGGNNLKAIGVKLFSDHEDMNAAGLTFKILFKHLFLAKKLLNYLNNVYKPDLVLMVDYGGFNLFISKYLKKSGFKTFYYIPPQIWASRKWRIHKVKKYIDEVFTIFPFEIPMYKKYGINAKFVGHPLTQELPHKSDRDVFFEQHNLDKNKKLVAIFPGSRPFELKHMMTTFLKTKKILEKKCKNVQFVISEAMNFEEGTLKQYLKNENIMCIRGENHALLSVADTLILTSGTVALEAALYETPMVIAYKAPWLFYLVYLMVRCIKNVSLPNIILGKNVIKELIQYKATPKKISNEILKILNDEQYRLNMINNLKQVREHLTENDAPKIVAEEIMERLK